MFGLVPFRNRSNGIVRGSDFGNLEKLMDSFWNDSFMPVVFSGNGSFKTDIRETDEAYHIDAELPGIKKDDIQVKLENDRLTISVSYNEDKEEKNGEYLRRERRLGQACRSFSVEGIKEDEVKAKYEDGILSLSLPKTEKVEKSKNIEIQ